MRWREEQRDWLTRLARFGVFTFLVCLIWQLPGQAMSQSPVWGFRPGDVFVVDMGHEKTTTVVLPESEPVVSRTTDLVELQYLVRDVDPTGDMTVEVRVLKSLRDPGDHANSVSLDASRRLELLEGAAITLRVAPDGVVDAIAESDRRTLINQLAGLDNRIAATLDEVLQAETIVSLLGRPFWCVVPVVRDEPRSVWTRQDRVSLGLCGHLQSTIRCDLQGEGPERTLRLTGDARFVPHVAPSGNATAVEFADVDVREIGVEGEGRMVIPPGDDDRESGYRPHFDELRLTVDFEGAAVLQSGERRIPLTFHQQQTIRMKLNSWRTGRPTLVVPGNPVQDGSR